MSRSVDRKVMSRCQSATLQLETLAPRREESSVLKSPQKIQGADHRGSTLDYIQGIREMAGIAFGTAVALMNRRGGGHRRIGDQPLCCSAQKGRDPRRMWPVIFAWLTGGYRRHALMEPLPIRLRRSSSFNRYPGALWGVWQRSGPEGRAVNLRECFACGFGHRHVVGEGGSAAPRHRCRRTPVMFEHSVVTVPPGSLCLDFVKEMPPKAPQRRRH